MLSAAVAGGAGFGNGLFEGGDYNDPSPSDSSQESSSAAGDQPPPPATTSPPPSDPESLGDPIFDPLVVSRPPPPLLPPPPSTPRPPSSPLASDDGFPYGSEYPPSPPYAPATSGPSDGSNSFYPDSPPAPAYGTTTGNGAQAPTTSNGAGNGGGGSVVARDDKQAWSGQLVLVNMHEYGGVQFGLRSDDGFLNGFGRDVKLPARDVTNRAVQVGAQVAFVSPHSCD